MNMNQHYSALLLLVFSAVTLGGPTTQSPLQVWPCDKVPSPYQVWYPSAALVHLGGAAGLPDTGLVMNTLGYSNKSGDTLTIWTITPDDPCQKWFYDAATTTLRSAMNGLCAGTANATGVLPAGTAIVQTYCEGNAATQWTYNSTTGLFTWGLDSTMCLDAGTPEPSCSSRNQSDFPFCNPSLPTAQRVSSLLALMNDGEKAAMLAASNNGVPRLGVPPLRFGEALHGVLSGCGAAAPVAPSGYESTGCPTSFPTGLALGSTFNRTLWRAVGDVIGTEARALFNQNHVAQSLFFAPDANPCRDPRWGRCMEVASEDPVASAEFAANYVSGFQGPVSGDFIRSVCMVKHFLSYDQEGNFGPHDRTNFCAPISLRSLVEYHLPPFQAAVQRGRVGGVMCAASGYGIDGAPGAASCAHGEINNGVLRDTWGFDGAMVTDGNGVGNLWRTFGSGAMNCGNGSSGPTRAVRDGLRGGVDVELGETLNNYALAAIADGNITMADIDLALSRTLPWLFRLGLLNPPESVPWSSLGPADVDTASARQLAREAATQAIVLLRNDPYDGGAPLLPLDDSRQLARVAVIGPNADAPEMMLANYHGVNSIAVNHTPFVALSTALRGRAVVSTAPGCDSVLCPDSGGFAAALDAARASDLVIFVGGGAPWRGGANAFNATEGEEFDRTNITLPGLQEDLISAVLAVGTPVILVIMRGGSIALSAALLADARLTTILSVCYPGEMGGDALADILLGAVAPSGRLPTTAYPPEFVASREITDYNFSSADGITHLYYTGTPQWPFGFGLSTTTWNLTWIDDATRRIDAQAWVQDALLPPPFGVNVTNTGQRVSDISLLAFVSTDEPGEPIQKLFDFARTASVAPGETRTLLFTMPSDIAGSVLADGSIELKQGVLRVRIGAPGEMMLEASLHVDGRAQVKPPLFP